jgi:predicted nucleic acid-binding protein
LIILYQIGRLDLLKSIYNKVIITPTVAFECEAPLPEWIEIQSPANTSLQTLLEETIDPGESSAIALAVELKDCYLILDDLRARKVADRMGLSFTGTLGVIAAAKRRGIIAAARPVFEQIRQNNFWISEKFMQQILNELGE